MTQTAKRAMFSESFSAVSLQWDRGASTGTSESMKTRLRRSISLVGIDPLRRVLTLNGRNIPFVNNIKYLGVIFDRKITWRLHIEAIEDKAFRTFLSV
jgi:hypothetical protein